MSKINSFKQDIFEELNAMHKLYPQETAQTLTEWFLDDIYNCIYIPVKAKIKYTKEWLDSNKGVF